VLCECRLQAGRRARGSIIITLTALCDQAITRENFFVLTRM
jgi:hypothetical protein